MCDRNEAVAMPAFRGGIYPAADGAGQASAAQRETAQSVAARRAREYQAEADANRWLAESLARNPPTPDSEEVIYRTLMGHKRIGMY